MGTDIHLFVEYCHPADECKHSQVMTNSGTDFWAMGEFYQGRNYELFGHLAGVRGGFDGGVVPLRGLPSNISWSAKEKFLGVLAEVSGQSLWSSVPQPWEPECSGSLYYRPGYHSHTWLDISECMSAYCRAIHGEKRLAFDFEAVIAAMQVYEKAGAVTRVVLAFDS